MPIVSPDFNATTNWSGGGYEPTAPVTVTGGYDPTTGFAGTTNTIGGTAAITDMQNIGADFRGGYYGDQVERSGGGYDPNSPGYLDSSNSIGGQQAITENYDMGMGGVRSQLAGQINTAGSANPNPTVTVVGAPPYVYNDWRVKVGLASGSQLFYKNSGPTQSQNQIMGPLAETDGVIFPYVPQVTISHLAQYNSQPLTHSNYAMQFYQNSEVSDITISGEFTVQDVKEGQYLLASIYFFRACTKMFFGLETGYAGNPPPIVYLDGYGEHYFPHVPCVLTNFTHSLTSDVDYINIPTTTNNLTDTGYSPTTKGTRLPTVSTISITLRPIYSRRSLHLGFNLEDFAGGKLLSGKGSFL